MDSTTLNTKNLSVLITINGYKRKQVDSRYGSMEIEIPQNRKSTFEPHAVKKVRKIFPILIRSFLCMPKKRLLARSRKRLKLSMVSKHQKTSYRT